jgi:hypothetical protein
MAMSLRNSGLRRGEGAATEATVLDRGGRTLDQLDEQSVIALGINEGDQLVASPLPGSLIDQSNTPLLQGSERPIEIVDLVGDVVKALAPAL